MSDYTQEQAAERIKVLVGDIDRLRLQNEKLREFIRRQGFDDCSVAACNCGSFHRTALKSKLLACRSVLVSFTSHYPHGVSPYLDEAFSDANDVLAELG